MLRTSWEFYKPPTSVNRNKYRSFHFFTLGELAKINMRTKPKKKKKNAIRNADRKNKSKSLGTYARGVNSTGQV